MAYEVAYSTLVHNPMGIDHFAKTMATVAVAGQVDKRTITNLAVDADGDPAGFYFSINVYVPV